MRFELLPGGGIRARAFAKINLYLEILGLRPDGYHEIDTILQEVSLSDEIEFQTLPGSDEVRLTVAAEGGEPLDLSSGPDNLVVKAARLLARAGGVGAGRSGLSIRLLKRIPMGAGLGGGSSDAAASLLALSKLWRLDLGRPALAGLAAELGSDVPFFLHGGTARCQGRGEKVTPLGPPPGGERFHYVLVYPPIAIATSFIYRELDRLDPSPITLTSRSLLDTMSPASVFGALREGKLFYNRLQVVACNSFPELRGTLEEVEREPFLATLMSGSGSTVYGLCGSRSEAQGLASRLRNRVRGRVFVVESQDELLSFPGESPAERTSRG